MRPATSILLQAGSLQSSSSAKSLYHPTHLRIDSDSNQFQRSFNGRYPPELNYFCLIIYFFLGGGRLSPAKVTSCSCLKPKVNCHFPEPRCLGLLFGVPFAPQVHVPWEAIATAAQEGARLTASMCHGARKSPTKHINVEAQNGGNTSNTALGLQGFYFHHLGNERAHRFRVKTSLPMKTSYLVSGV